MRALTRPLLVSANLILRLRELWSNRSCTTFSSHTGDTAMTNTEQATNEATNEATVTSKPKAARKTPAKSAKKSPAKKSAKGKKTPKSTKGGAVVKGPAILREYATRYHKDTEKKTAGGNASIDNDDEVAKKFRGKDIDAVYAITAKALKVDEKELRTRYAKLNVGMQRMNLGNRFRAALNAKA